MDEDEHTDRKQQLAMLYQKLNKIKKSLNEGIYIEHEFKMYILYNSMSTHPMHCNLCSLITDDTDNINQVISSNSPKSCHSYLTDLEKKGDPYTDRSHLTRLVDSYTRVFSNMPLGQYCENESYARMLVRFAELKGWVDIWIWKNSTHCCCLQSVLGYLDFYYYWIRIQDVNEAEDNFKVASSHCQNFAFVHIAHAQFERSQGRDKHIFKIILTDVKILTWHTIHWSYCLLSCAQGTQRELFTSCKMLLNWVQNQRK